MKAIPDSPVGVSCGLHCPPAPLWIIKGKPRVSQRRGKLSSAPKWNTDSYPPIYPFPSTRCSRGSAFTDLWLVFESSRRKQLSLWNTRFNTIYEALWAGLLLCGGCTAPRDGTSTRQQLPKLWQGDQQLMESTAQNSLTRSRSSTGWHTRNDPHLIHMSQGCPWCFLISGSSQVTPGWGWGGAHSPQQPRAPTEKAEKGLEQAAKCNFPQKPYEQQSDTLGTGSYWCIYQPSNI